MIFVNGRTLSKRMVLCATGSLRFQEGKQQQQQQQKQQQQLKQHQQQKLMKQQQTIKHSVRY